MGWDRMDRDDVEQWALLSGPSYMCLDSLIRSFLMSCYVVLRPDTYFLVPLVLGVLEVC